MSINHEEGGRARGGREKERQRETERQRIHNGYFESISF